LNQQSGENIPRTQNAPRKGVAIDSSKTSPLRKVLLIYGGLVNKLERVATNIDLQRLNENFERRGWGRLVESVINDIGKQMSTIQGFLDDLDTLDTRLMASENIDGATLNNLDKLRDRAIKAMRTIGNFSNKTTDNQEREELTDYINFMRLAINNVLSVLRIHRQLANDSSFQEITDADIVPESTDKVLHSKDRFHRDI
jgi:hypothetical protein